MRIRMKSLPRLWARLRDFWYIRPMMPTPRARCVVGAAFAFLIPLSIALAFVTRGALAADPAQTPSQIQAARELFAAASRDESALRWTEALAKLRRVAEVKLTAGVRYHIAYCEEKLGQLASALAHYTEARDAADREHSKDVLDLLKEPTLTLLRARVPTLTVVVHPANVEAEVTIDGRRIPSGQWRAAQPVDPGVHRVEARAAERDTFAREVTLQEGDAAIVDVILASSRPGTPGPAPRPH
jgi:hypothetical protein